ncbi:hypothetical protein CPC08DRAFT_713157 [Agrocybe pediades]|nr:hypothetical protein CPC08DRAFT_713157 [Agrocybe pediades]
MVAGPIKIPRPVLYEFSSLDSEQLPSLPWVQRHDPQFHSDIVGFDDIFNRASYR